MACSVSHPALMACTTLEQVREFQTEHAEAVPRVLTPNSTLQGVGAWHPAAPWLCGFKLSRECQQGAFFTKAASEMRAYRQVVLLGPVQRN